MAVHTGEAWPTVPTFQLERINEALPSMREASGSVLIMGAREEQIRESSDPIWGYWH